MQSQKIPKNSWGFFQTSVPLENPGNSTTRMLFIRPSQKACLNLRVLSGDYKADKKNNNIALGARWNSPKVFIEC